MKNLVAKNFINFILRVNFIQRCHAMHMKNIGLYACHMENIELLQQSSEHVVQLVKLPCSLEVPVNVLYIVVAPHTLVAGSLTSLSSS